MPYAGWQFKPREMADYLYAKWQSQDERMKALAVAIAESKLSVGAWNDNVDEDGDLLSRDCGLYQINVPASQLSAREPKLRTASLAPADWEPVTRYNVATARQMYDAPWPRDGVIGKRRWQAWVAYTTGWATFPEWWVWRHADGVPVGPWIATGRYIQKAIIGWANWYCLIRSDKTPEQALAFAQKHQARWRVQGELVLSRNRIAWGSFPRKSAAPPPDGVGPRPKPNSGL